MAALATALGPAGVSIVRVSGPAALGVARRVCPGLPDPPRPRHLYLRSLVHPATGEALDQGLVVYFPPGASFTGEPMAELHGHGGTAQARALLEAVLAAGAEPAPAGAFTRRAVANGRLDLARAEGIAELVSASSSAGLRAARALMDGRLSRRVLSLLEPLEDLLAEWEGVLDFPEDVHPEAEAAWPRRVGDLARALEALAASWQQGRRLRDGARVVLVGPPNAGKSSLLNALAGYDRVLVDAVPGTTRDLVELRLELGGVTATLVDGAGLRNADSPVEAQGVARLESVARGADLVVAVFDGSVAPGPEADRALALAAEAGSRALLVLNKADLGASAHDALTARLPGVEALPTSAPRAEGVPALLGALEGRLAGEAAGEGEVVVTLARHQEALRTAVEALGAASAWLSEGVALDAAVEELRQARRSLAGILDRSALTEDLLDRIFAGFCVGK